MARRHSYISNEITSALTEMRENITFTHLQETGFDPAAAALSLIEPMVEGHVTWLTNTPKDLRKMIDLQWDNTMLIVVPLPDRYIGYNNATTYSAPVMDNGYSFFKWIDYREQIYTTLPPGTERNKVRGLSFAVNFEKRIVPSRWFHPRAYNNVVDAPDEGILITPKRMPDLLTDDMINRLVKLHDLYVLAEYCYEFGRVAAKHISTEGIAKKVWPESANFLSTRGATIEKAKASTWPVDLRRRLTDLKGPQGEELEDNGVSTGYLQGQLHRIGDMILTSKLMTTAAEYASSFEPKNPDHKLSGIEFTPVNIDPDYIADYC